MSDTGRPDVVVSISIRTLLLAAGGVALAWALASIGSALLMILVSVFSVAVLSPVATSMQRRLRWSRALCSTVLVLGIVIAGKAKADLEQDVATARASAQAQAEKLRKSADASKGKLSVWWNDVQRSWNEHGGEDSRGRRRQAGGARRGKGAAKRRGTPKTTPRLRSSTRVRRSRKPSTRCSTPPSRGSGSTNCRQWALPA